MKTRILLTGANGYIGKRLLPVLAEMGHDTLLLDREATRNGAVETPEEGAIYAEFLRENRGKYGGIILSLPNFGDENGAVAALKEADVPILKIGRAHV